MMQFVLCARTAGGIETAASDQLYYQYLSLRYRTTPATTSPNNTPNWQTLPELAAGVQQLVPFPDPQDGVWALTADAKLYAVMVQRQHSNDGASATVRAVNITLPRGAVLAAAAAGAALPSNLEPATIAVVSPSAATWYAVSKDVAIAVGSVSLPSTTTISTVNAAACAPSAAPLATARVNAGARARGRQPQPCATVFIATDVGLFQATLAGVVAVPGVGLAESNVTTVTTRARGTGGYEVAAATALAVFYDNTLTAAVSAATASATALPPAVTFMQHELIGGLIDDVPTALALVRPSDQPPASCSSAAPTTVDCDGIAAQREYEVWVSNSFSVSVVRLSGAVDRFGGTAGLPLVGVTHLSVGSGDGAPDQLYIAAGTGIAAHIPSAALASRASPSTSVARSGSSSENGPKADTADQGSAFALPDAAAGGGAQYDDVWRLFRGDRWLPSGGNGGNPLDGKITAIAATASEPAAGGARTLWAATASGLARITGYATTLSRKADAYTGLALTFSRYKWIASIGLPQYGNVTASARPSGPTPRSTPRNAPENATTSAPSRSSEVEAEHDLVIEAPDNIVKKDGDNDGLWTAMFVVAMAAKAQAVESTNATAAAEARALAWDHFAALEFLHNVTGEGNGFIARTAVRCGEPHGNGDGTICNATAPNSCGWVNSSVCYHGVDDAAGVDTAAAAAATTAPPSKCCWTYKRDTSSDEVMGHVWAFTAVHQMLATTDAERARVAYHLCKAVKYIVDAGFVFVDPNTGRRTTWGYWSPELLNGVPGKMDERGGNAHEALAFLASANMMCGDFPQPEGKTFGDAFVELVRVHQYDRNIVNALVTSPADVASFDFRLYTLATHTLFLAAPELASVLGAAAANPSAESAAEDSNTAKTSGKCPAGINLTSAECTRVRSRVKTSIGRYWLTAYSGAGLDGRTSRIRLMDIVYQLVTGDKGGKLEDPLWQLRR